MDGSNGTISREGGGKEKERKVMLVFVGSEEGGNKTNFIGSCTAPFGAWLTGLGLSQTQTHQVRGAGGGVMPRKPLQLAMVTLMLAAGSQVNKRQNVAQF
jgi:hypothetical protein